MTTPSDTPRTDAEEFPEAISKDPVVPADFARQLERENADYSLTIKALMQGWTVEKASLYDEEGVDGWRWTSPKGDEFCEIGDWNEIPTLPTAARELIGRG